MVTHEEACHELSFAAICLARHVSTMDEWYAEVDRVISAVEQRASGLPTPRPSAQTTAGPPTRTSSGPPIPSGAA